jgi:hypothetical protein
MKWTETLLAAVVASLLWGGIAKAGFCWKPCASPWRTRDCPVPFIEPDLCCRMLIDQLSEQEGDKLGSGLGNIADQFQTGSPGLSTLFDMGSFSSSPARTNGSGSWPSGVPGGSSFPGGGSGGGSWPNPPGITPPSITPPSVTPTDPGGWDGDGGGSGQNPVVPGPSSLTVAVLALLAWQVAIRAGGLPFSRRAQRSEGF